MIGVVVEVDEGKTTGKGCRRELTLADQEGTLTVVLWGSIAQQDVNQGDVVLLKTVSRKSEDVHGGFNSTLMVNPECPKTQDLKDWFQKQSERPKKVQKLSPIKDLGDSKGGTIEGTISRVFVEKVEELCVFLKVVVMDNDSAVELSVKEPNSFKLLQKTAKDLASMEDGERESFFASFKCKPVLTKVWMNTWGKFVVEKIEIT